MKTTEASAFRLMSSTKSTPASLPVFASELPLRLIVLEYVDRLPGQFNRRRGTYPPSILAFGKRLSLVRYAKGIGKNSRSGKSGIFWDVAGFQRHDVWNSLTHVATIALVEFCNVGELGP